MTTKHVEALLRSGSTSSGSGSGKGVFWGIS
jgi:hypothetical protein